MTEKKNLIDNLNDTGNQIKSFAAVVSVMGAVVISVGVIVKYFTRK